MKVTSFYSDVPYHALLSAGLSIVDAPRVAEGSSRQILVGYLRGGVAIDQCPGVGVDVFDPSKHTPLDVMTDGEWVWPADAAHYCSEHGIGPHPDFVAKIVRLQGVAPIPTAQELETITEEFFSGLVFDEESTFASPETDERA